MTIDETKKEIEIYIKELQNKKREEIKDTIDISALLCLISVCLGSNSRMDLKVFALAISLAFGLSYSAIRLYNCFSENGSNVSEDLIYLKKIRRDLEENRNIFENVESKEFKPKLVKYLERKREIY